jgi:excisionase family DNA binding protein
MEMEPLFTIAEVADYFHVDERTIRNWIRDGKIRAVRVGGIVRIRESEVTRLVEGKK